MTTLKKKAKEGFSLVELMIVIVIISILSAVGVPMFQSMTSNAIDRAKLANARTLIESTQRYAAAEGLDVDDVIGLNTELDAYIAGGYASAMKVKDEVAIWDITWTVEDLTDTTAKSLQAILYP